MAQVAILTDLSDNAMHAAEHAVRLFGATGNTYLLVHAITDVPVDPYMAQWTTLELMKTAEEGLQLFTDRFVQSTGAEGVERRVVYGSLAPVVRNLVVEERIDLVVMGRRGRARAPFFGSSAVEVIKHSHATVLVVSENTPFKKVERILLADDRKEVLPADLAPLRTIASLAKAKVLVAHLEIGGPEAKDHWNQGLYELALKDVEHSFTSVLESDVVEGIEHLAHERRVEMIAVLHRHLGLLESLFHRSAAAKLALGTELPLLVLQLGTH